MPTPVPLTRIISVPAAEIATALAAGLNKPVVASPKTCGFVAFADVPKVRLPIENGIQLDPLQPWKALPLH
jgi:hypothetical protein